MPKKGTPLANDNDLAGRTRNDNFWINRLLKFTLLGCSLAVIIGLTILLVCKIASDAAFRDGIAMVMQNNLVGIIIGVAAILGVNLRGAFKRDE